MPPGAAQPFCRFHLEEFHHCRTCAMTDLIHFLHLSWEAQLVNILQNHRVQEVLTWFASRRHGAHISRAKDLVEKARKMIIKLKIGMPTLVKATGPTPAINIDVTGSSNTSVKTELSSPGQPKVWLCMLYNYAIYNMYAHGEIIYEDIDYRKQVYKL